MSRGLFVLALLAILAFGAEKRLEWRGDLVDIGIGGDGLHYWHLAVNIERNKMISLDGKTPTWARLPGYPALLALTTEPARSDTGAKNPISVRDRVWAWRDRMTRVNLAIDLACGLFASLLALALGGGPFALGAALWWSMQPWSTVIAIHPLADGLATAVTAAALAALASAARRRSMGWFFLAGALCGVGQWVRADTLLLLPALGFAGLFAVGRPWERVGFAGVALLGWALVFAPWPARNRELFGEAHPWGGTSLDAAGKPIDRTSAFAWMRTWCEGREEETIRVAWPFPGQGVWTAMVPPHAWDSEDERVRVSSLLVEYNRNGNKLTPELTAKLDAITAERLKAHRFKVWVRLPVRRVLNRLFAPRDGFGMGTLPPLGLGPERERWIRADTVITLAGLLALLLVALDRNRRGIGLALFGWILLRAFVVTWLNPAPEPRYFLEFLPVFAAGAAVLPWRILEMVRNRSRAADARAG